MRSSQTKECALIMPDADMNLAALQQRHLIHPKSFHQLHAHIGEVFRIPRQEFRQDALDRLRRRGELEHAEVSALKQLDAFAERPHLAQHAAAICEQLLAPGGQKKAAADPVKKLEPSFVFEFADLPRKSRLADAQPHRRLRHRAEVGHRDEGSQAFQVHSAYLQIA
jgi:hypothetical protein